MSDSFRLLDDAPPRASALPRGQCLRRALVVSLAVLAIELFVATDPPLPGEPAWLRWVRQLGLHPWRSLAAIWMLSYALLPLSPRSLTPSAGHGQGDGTIPTPDEVGSG